MRNYWSVKQEIKKEQNHLKRETKKVTLKMKLKNSSNTEQCSCTLIIEKQKSTNAR